jgi:hypothetical protein
MGFLDKAKAAAEEAATKARAGVADVQAKRETGHAYTELGQETYRLIEAGEVTHPALVAIAEKIRSASADAPGEPSADAPAEPSADAPAEPVAAGQPEVPPVPPAMPS